MRIRRVWGRAAIAGEIRVCMRPLLKTVLPTAVTVVSTSDSSNAEQQQDLSEPYRAEDLGDADKLTFNVAKKAV